MDDLRKAARKEVCFRVTPETDIIKSHPRLLPMVCLSKFHNCSDSLELFTFWLTHKLLQSMKLTHLSGILIHSHSIEANIPLWFQQANQTSPHVETSIFRVDDRHVEESNVEPISEYWHLEPCFELWLIKARKSWSGISWFKMCSC